MLASAVFVCGNTRKCTNSIAETSLNPLQVKAIRRAPKTCTNCKQTTKWLEQQALFDNIETKQSNGGRKNAKSTYSSH